MLRDVDQVRPDWKTNKVFDKLSKQVASMINPNLEHLKEGISGASERRDG
jgi:hypothetical protein